MKSEKAAHYGTAGLATLKEATIQALGKTPHNSSYVRVALFGRKATHESYRKVVVNVLKLLQAEGRVERQGNGWRLPD
ncbi:MAG: hypothetical protein OXH15_16575 [Gammaproteobacteria bacterium]|nr:hypothetical protein [Gammaproteobacteria bacterium]